MSLFVTLGAKLQRLSDRAAGWAVLYALPRLRDELLASWPTDGVDLRGRRRTLFRALAREVERVYYDPRTSVARREELRRLCQRPEAPGRAPTEGRGRWLAHPEETSRALQEEIAARLSEGSVRSVHQIACGDGRLLAQLAHGFPTVFFCGSESDPDRVDRCRRRWRDIPNLAFTTLRLERAHEIGEAHAFRADLIFAEGGLHLLGEDVLRHLLGEMRRASPVFLLAQPVERRFDAETPRSSPRGRLSWSHPYSRYLRDAGFEEIRLREELVPGRPDEKVVAVFASDPAHARRAA